MEFEGKDLEEALEAAAKALGVAEPELDYEIVEHGRRGLFGIGARSVRIRVLPPMSSPDEERFETRAEPREPARPQRQREAREPRELEPEDVPEDTGEPVSENDLDGVESTAADIVRLIGYKLDVRAEAEGSRVIVGFSGSDSPALLRKDGEVLTALQVVLNRMSRRSWPSVSRIQLECEGGTSRRDDDLVELIREVARQVARTGKSKRLHPMNAYERRIVHITVRKHQGLGSRSEGEGAMKQVRIFRQGGRRG